MFQFFSKPLLSDTLFNQLPILEFNGSVITQSYNMARFLAREFKLAGKDNVENGQADMLVDYFGNDLAESKLCSALLKSLSI